MIATEEPTLLAGGAAVDHHVQADESLFVASNDSDGGAYLLANGAVVDHHVQADLHCESPFIAVKPVSFHVPITS
ncbi:hypothetical protein V6N13_051607 [Hibiscus sabdariffa]|uniref:Uncharacterized protein n=2 Tax=Hibiscus sabdariffa TaxID=183260 RepID=A0ABR1ZG28_9ROSI